MPRLLCCILMLAAALAAVPARAQDAPLFPTEPVVDAELATKRGGFRLPGGVEVALAATITTSVDGARLLQTVLQVGPAGASTQVTGSATATIDVRGGSAAASLPGLSVEHFIGQRIGSMIVNAGDNRVIDSRVTVDLSLAGVRPLTIGSAIFRVQAIGIDAGIWRATGG